MLVECEWCREPLTEDARLCSSCGAVNPSYEPKGPAPLAKAVIILAGLAFFVVVAPHLPRGSGPFVDSALRLVMAVGALGLGTVVFVDELRRLSRKRRVMDQGNRGVGTVSRTIVRHDRSDHDDRTARVSPIVRFVTDRGDAVEFQAPAEGANRWGRSYWSQVHQDGQKVEVAYDPAHPSTAFVVGRPDRDAFVRLGMSIAFVVAGLVLLFKLER